MALSTALQKKIETEARNFWNVHCADSGFGEITRGKEVGHRIADYVDDRTTALLKVKFDTRYEADAKGTQRKRSMGDVWIGERGIFNPVNVKAGLQDMNGQPNLVSMQKLLDYILNHWVDSYYLLIVKFALGDAIVQKTVMVDLLEWLDFVAYDAGPGQIMLREKDFFDALARGHKPKSRTMAEKVDCLFAKFEAGVDALMRNRKNRLQRQKRKFDDFGSSTFVLDQSGLKFVP
jgi:hypothetical protein